MYLYHYAKAQYPLLTTRLVRANQTLTRDEIANAKQEAVLLGNPGSYFESISFFFDPIPLEMIGDHFQNKHHTWVNGNKLFEYVVDTASLERDILYDIVETPADFKAMNAVDWTDPKTDTDAFFVPYMREKNTRKRRSGEQGRGVANLVKNARQYVGGTRQAYLANNQLSKAEQDDIKDKYAANVPHVMLYPKQGKIRYKSVSEVVVGVGTKPPLEQTQFPRFFDWMGDVTLNSPGSLIW